MTAQYEDWADWAGDHPEQAEAELLRDREAAESRAVAAFRERMKLGAAAEIVVEYAGGSAEPVALHVIPTPPSACDKLGHEYNFGICLDCEHVDPNHEPADGQIPGAYQIQKAAA